MSHERQAGDTQGHESVAILGAGKLGVALAESFARAGATVTLGVQRPAAVRSKFEARGIEVSTAEAAIRESEIVVLALPGEVVVSTVELHAELLRAKIVVDCANPIAKGPGGDAVWGRPNAGSLSQTIAAALESGRVVKAFNTFGFEFYAEPVRGERATQVLIASDDAHAKERVSSLASRAGFVAIDAGPLHNASLLENLAVLWTQLAVVGGHGRDLVFELRRVGK